MKDLYISSLAKYLMKHEHLERYQFVIEITSGEDVYHSLIEVTGEKNEDEIAGIACVFREDLKHLRYPVTFIRESNFISKDKRVEEMSGDLIAEEIKSLLWSYLT